MSEKTEVNYSGIGVTGAMFLIFLTLKLCGVIAWSWWWITAPLWTPALLTLIVLLILFTVFMCKLK